MDVKKAGSKNNTAKYRNVYAGRNKKKQKKNNLNEQSHETF